MAKAPTEIRSLARSHTEEAINCIVGIIRNGTSEPAKVAAANSILDRGWGKAPTVLENGEDGPLQIIIRRFTDAATDASE